jgi:hypothetical protein
MDSLHSLYQLHDLDKKQQSQLALLDEKQAEKAIVAFKEAPKAAVVRREQEKALQVVEPSA